MILEGLVTTLSPEGELNIAPMGPKIPADMSLGTFVLRPYRSSTTYRNLKAGGAGVFHITDDVLLLARTAIGAALDPPPATIPARAVLGRVLADACRYYEFRPIVVDDIDERTTVLVETLAEGRIRDFLGFNRAKHAVVEAAILATRTAFLPLSEILEEFQKFTVIVDKTGGPAEREALDLLLDHVRRSSRPPLESKAPSS